MEVKIFVSDRIDVNSASPSGNVFVPIRCGAVYDQSPLSGAAGDDTGENISEKQPSYSELTVQYWAWKNAEADYYGLCHYRRHLNFSGVKYKTDLCGNILADRIDGEAIERYGLTDERVAAAVSDYDIVASAAVDVSKMPIRCRSLRDHYAKADALYERDLDSMLEAISEVAPEYRETAERYLAGKKGYFCNLFVMKKELFHAYSEWLFRVLGAADARLEMSHYSKQSLRTPGHLAERLFGIWLTYRREHDPALRVRELQTVLFERPVSGKPEVLRAAFPKENAVPLVFAANDGFAAVCAVAIRSAVRASDPNRNYDVVVLHREIAPEHQRWMRETVRDFPNVSLRFYNTAAITERFRLRPKEHISIETYYRFLIPEILPDYEKVLYLDCDLICRRDLAGLYDTDLAGAWLAAAPDPDMQGQIATDPRTERYVREVLKMDDPYAYFQAGVLLLNTKLLQAAHSTEEWLTFAAEPYRYGDQDILNRYCGGNVRYLDVRWNTLIDCDRYRVPVLIEAAPHALREAYHAARRDPSIVHYAGYQKPWNTAECDLAPYFWEAAKETPFYEELFARLCGAAGGKKKKKTGKSRFVLFCKAHCPRFLYRFAKWVQRLLRL